MQVTADQPRWLSVKIPRLEEGLILSLRQEQLSWWDSPHPGEADDLQVSFIFKTGGGTDHCFRAGEMFSAFRVLNGHCFVLILKNLSVVL